MPPPTLKPWRWPRPAFLGVALLGLLALVVYVLFSEHGYFAARRQQKEVERLEQEIKHLEEENRRLAEEIETLKSDPGAIERAARERLKMARPGEKVIILPAPKPPASEADTPAEEKP